MARTVDAVHLESDLVEQARAAAGVGPAARVRVPVVAANFWPRGVPEDAAGCARVALRLADARLQVADRGRLSCRNPESC
eukprot:SAG31_NODE_5841_length_2301_cov_2.349228_2_plen_80_part_00